MKKSILSIFLLFTVLFSANSQTWTRMQSWGSDFEDIFWITDQKGVIVGDRLIAYTENGGETWQEVLQPFDFRFTGVTFWNSNQGIAIGEAGKLFITQDGGHSWLRQNSGTDENLLAIGTSRSGTALIVGTNGLVLKSTDQGSSWIKMNQSNSVDLLSISIPHEDSVFIGTESGQVLFSADQGNSWTTIQTPLSQKIEAIQIDSLGNWLLAGEGGKAGISSDFGETIQLFNLNTTEKLTDIRYFSGTSVSLLITASDGKAYISTNSGSDFSTINFDSELIPGLNKITVSPENRWFITGNSGTLIQSTDQGKTWTTSLRGNQTDFVTLDMESATYGFIGGRDGKIFVTPNRASTLIPRALPEAAELFSLEFWNTSFGYATTDSGIIYRTSNAGQSWVKRKISTSNDIKGIHVFLASFPYVVGGNGTIARSSGSSGDSWEVFGPNSTQTQEDINDISAFDLQTAFAVGDGGKILWSNNGSIWESIPSGTTENLTFATRINGTSAYAVGHAGTALKTTDLGRSWRLIPTGVSENLNGVDFFGENFALAVGDHGVAIVSNDGGESWTKLETGTLHNLYAAFTLGPNDAIASGENGTILNYNCQPPSGRLSSITGATEICVSSQVYAISDTPEPGSNLIWRVDGGTIIAGQGTSQIEVLWGNAGRGGVFVNRSNFCGTGETSFLEVNIEASPVSTLEISGNGVACLGEISSFSIPYLENHEYSWNVSGGAIIEGQNSPAITVSWTEIGLQSVSLEIKNKCGISTLKTLPIQIYAAPEQPSSISGEAVVSLLTAIYEIENIPGLDYQWSLSGGGQLLTGQGSSRVIVSWEEEGTHLLSVKAQNECDFGPEQSLSVMVSVITAIDPEISESTIKLFPNPSTGSVSLESPQLDRFVKLSLINSLGQTIQARPIFPGETQVLLEGLPRGLNFVVLEGKRGRVVKKILVK